MTEGQAAGRRGRGRLVVTYVLGVGIVTGMVVYLSRNVDLVATLRSLSVATLVIVLAMTACNSLLHGAQFRRMSGVFGVKISFSDGLGLATTGSMLNYMVPLTGGMVMRAAYMKVRHGMAYTDYGALLASTQLILIVACGATGLLLSGLAVALGQPASWALTALFAAVIAAGVGGYLVIERVGIGRFAPKRVARHVVRFTEGFSRWRRRPGTLLWLMGTTGVMIIISGGRFVIILSALGARGPLMPVFTVAAAAAVVNALNLTPGGLGLRELTAAAAAGLVGIDPDIALLASLIERAATLVTTMALGLPYSQTLVHRAGGEDPESRT